MKKILVTILLLFSICCVSDAANAFAPIERHLMYHPSKIIKPIIEQLKNKTETKSFVNSDGLVLKYLHINKHNSKLPVLVYCHGNSNNSTYYQDKMTFFADLGFEIFMLDYRGFGSSEGKTSEKGFYRDLNDFVNYLESNYDYKRNDLIIWGHSLGGAIVADVVSKEDDFKATILESTFTSMQGMKEYTKNNQTNCIKKAFYNVMPLSQRFSTIDKISKITSPLLILCSNNDEVIPCYMSDELKKQANHAILYKTDKAFHDDVGWQYYIVLDFINRNK